MAADETLPLSGHLLELRQRLLKVAIPVLLLVILLFPCSLQALRGLRDGLIPGYELVALSPLEPLVSRAKISLVGGVLLILPWALAQGYGFVSPGLHPKERGAFRLALILGGLFFLIGAVLSGVLLSRALIGVSEMGALGSELRRMGVDDFVSLVLLTGLSGGGAALLPAFLLLIFSLSREGFPLRFRRISVYPVLLGLFFFLAPGGHLLLMALLVIPWVAVGEMILFLGRRVSCREELDT